MKKISVFVFFASFLAFQQQVLAEIARVRFTWDFNAEKGGAIYFNVCTEPDFNTDQRTGGCARIDVHNSNESSNISRTVILWDKLQTGTEYKACLVADNVPGVGSGRHIKCYQFKARDKMTLNFSVFDMRFVGRP